MGEYSSQPPSAIENQDIGPAVAAGGRGRGAEKHLYLFRRSAVVAMNFGSLRAYDLDSQMLWKFPITGSEQAHRIFVGREWPCARLVFSGPRFPRQLRPPFLRPSASARTSAETTLAIAGSSSEACPRRGCHPWRNTARRDSLSAPVPFCNPRILSFSCRATRSIPDLARSAFPGPSIPQRAHAVRELSPGWLGLRRFEVPGMPHGDRATARTGPGTARPLRQ